MKSTRDWLMRTMSFEEIRDNRLKLHLEFKSTVNPLSRRMNPTDIEIQARL
jgi:hypothetical protein